VIVLDTNVVSELIRHVPDVGVIQWVDRIPADEVFLTAVTAAELRHGVARLPDGRRKHELAAKVEKLLTDRFEGRVLPFDCDAAMPYAQIAAARERAGRPISMPDAQIAAICRSCGADLATRNVKDFVDTGVYVDNPWTG
jgi:toxin FitB